MTEPQPDAVVKLRDRLVALRSDLIARLADLDAVDAGLLHLLASTEAVLAVLEREAA